ncbi:MAG: right-handed parallel beta-helix repeat-containing protein, partial [Candidatus Micrarchaeota archaeon]
MNNLKLFSIFLGLVFLTTLGFSTFNNNSCGTIDAAGTYIVNVSSITSSDGNSCINITTSNVVLNLNGSYIDGAINGGKAAIYVYNSTEYLTNITVANGTVNASRWGVYLRNVENSTIANISAFNNSEKGFYLYTSSNNTLTSNTANNHSNGGFYLYESSNNNNLTSNTASNNSIYGFYLYASSNNTLTSNNASN